MHTAPLACPHCSSAVNYGINIAAGSAIECLICMQTFVTEVDYVPAPVDNSANEVTMEGWSEKTNPGLPAVEIPVGKLETPASKPAKARPRTVVPIARPAEAIAETCTAVAAPMLEPEAPERNRPAPKRRDTPAQGGRLGVAVMVAFGAVLLIMGAGGAGIAYWKLTGQPRSTPHDADSTQPTTYAAVDKNADTGAQANTPNPGSPAKSDTDAEKKPALSPDEEDEQERRLMEAARQQLVRKTPSKSNTPAPNWNPIVNVQFAPQTVTGLDQQQIDAAIDKGIVYLKTNQNANGTWGSGHGVGYAAVGGLTLLECNVPRDDLFVTRAAKYVRMNSVNLGATYELSLAILFLDRLGDPRDRLLIQGMALRLLAGQLDGGGWTYNCAKLDPQDMYQLYTFLHSNKRPNFFDPVPGDPRFAQGVPGNPGMLNPITGKPNLANPVGAGANFNDPFKEFNDLILQKAVADAKSKSTTGTSTQGKPNTGQTIPPANPGAIPMNPANDPQKFNIFQAAKAGKYRPNPIPPQWLKKNLQGLPIVQIQGKGKAQLKGKRPGGGDNSNTQFALLALWAARRHDIPTELGLLASYQRFNASQNNDGGWGYHVTGGSTPSMTAVGLLGEAMGHGTSPEFIADPTKPGGVSIRPALQDPKIQAGLKRLAKNIGTPLTTDKTPAMENLYFMWSVERVAMLYDLKTIDGKDWYGWGAQLLVRNQHAAGSWPTSRYPGASAPLNTCFALLFLKRSNLVPDLTDNLRLQTAIRE